MPESWNHIIAELIVIAEIVTGVGLMLPVTTRAAAAFAVSMLGTFSVAVAFVLARGTRDIGCGCMVIANETIGLHIIIRNIILGLLLAPQLWPEKSAISIWLTAVAVPVFGWVASSEARRPVLRAAAPGGATRGCAGCNQSRIETAG